MLLPYSLNLNFILIFFFSVYNHQHRKEFFFLFNLSVILSVCVFECVSEIMEIEKKTSLTHVS
jgi:hypothetical protein